MAATLHHVHAHSALGTPLLAGGPRQWAAPVQLLHGVLLRVGRGRVGGHQPRWQRRLRRPCDCCRRLSDVFNGSVVAPLRLLHMDAGLLPQPSSARMHYLVVGEGQESFDAPATIQIYFKGMHTNSIRLSSVLRVYVLLFCKY